MMSSKCLCLDHEPKTSVRNCICTCRLHTRCPTEVVFLPSASHSAPRVSSACSVERGIFSPAAREEISHQQQDGKSLQSSDPLFHLSGQRMKHHTIPVQSAAWGVRGGGVGFNWQSIMSEEGKGYAGTTPVRRKRKASQHESPPPPPQSDTICKAFFSPHKDNKHKWLGGKITGTFIGCFNLNPLVIIQ